MASESRSAHLASLSLHPGSESGFAPGPSEEGWVFGSITFLFRLMRALMGPEDGIGILFASLQMESARST